MCLVKLRFYIPLLLVCLSPAHAMMSSDPLEKEEQKPKIIIEPIVEDLADAKSSVASDLLKASNQAKTNQISAHEMKEVFIQYAEKIKDLSSRMTDLAFSQNWQEIIELAKETPFPALPKDFLKKGTFIQEYFNYIAAVSNAYQEAAKQALPLTAKLYYEKGIALCSQYLDDIREYQPNDPIQKVCLLVSQQDFQTRLGELHQGLFFNLLGPIPSSNLPPYLWKAIKHFQSAIANRKETLMLLNQWGDETLLPTIKQMKESYPGELINSYKANIFKSYLGLIIELPQNSGLQLQLFTKAKETLAELKREDKNLYKYCAQIFQALEKEFQAQTLTQNPARTGEKVRSLFIEKLRGEANQALRQANTFFALDENSASDLTIEYMQFMTLAAKELHSEAFSSLKALEAKILEDIAKEAHPRSAAINEEGKVRQLCMRLVKVGAIEHFIDKIIFCYINNNDVEGAFLRVQAFNVLEKERRGEICWPTKVLTAFVKNLMGDHDEWLEIENIVSKAEQGREEKKQKYKTRVRKNYIDKIKEEIREREAIRLEQELRFQAIAQQQSRKQSQEVGYREGSITSPFSVEEPSSQQQRLEKLRRHQEALKQKEDAAIETSQLGRAATKPLNEKPPTNDDDQPAESLSNLYSLKSSALFVDQEIESDGWNFSRVDLKNYFEALGCIYMPGKGSHAKIKLPEAIHVMYEKNLITVLNTEGGSLTLPRWDDRVPYYLRKQILIARQKIAVIKKKL